MLLGSTVLRLTLSAYSFYKSMLSKAAVVRKKKLIELLVAKHTTLTVSHVYGQRTSFDDTYSIVHILCNTQLIHTSGYSALEIKC